MSYEILAKSNFVGYVLQFYGENGLYPLKASPEQVIQATAKLLSSGHEFVGDSWDRELVRDILINEFGLKYN